MLGETLKSSLFLSKYTSNQLVNTLANSLCKALHVGEITVALQRPIPELTVDRYTHITKKDGFMNRTVGNKPKLIDKQNAYMPELV